MATHRSRGSSRARGRTPTAGRGPLRRARDVCGSCLAAAVVAVATVVVRLRRAPWVGAASVLGVAGVARFRSSLVPPFREPKKEPPVRPTQRADDIVETIRFARSKPRPPLGSNSSHYIPSAIESLVSDNAPELGYSVGDVENLANGCNIWTHLEKGGDHEKYATAMEAYRTRELPEYNRLLRAYLNDPRRGVRRARTPSDLRDRLRSGESRDTVCDELELHRDGLRKGVFPESGEFMLSELQGGQGYLEPLLPPLRHPGVCFDPLGYRLSLEYLVHDFSSMCRMLKPHSRTIFIDMGASLEREAESGIPPAFYITELYHKFGFHFDHIYAYEITPKDPEEIYSKIPDNLKAAYHWYNVGVNSSIDSSNNPFKLLREQYNDDDFVVVKLDIDQGLIENPLTKLLLDDDLQLFKLVDAFYFEQHVFEKTMSGLGWEESRNGTVQESLSLFENLRRRGIAAHSWI